MVNSGAAGRLVKVFMRWKRNATCRPVYCTTKSAVSSLGQRHIFQLKSFQPLTRSSSRWRHLCTAKKLEHTSMSA